MDVKAVYPSKNYSVNPKTGALEPERKGPVLAHVISEEEIYTHDPYVSLPRTSPPVPAWVPLLTIATALLALGLIATCILIPVYIVPTLTATTTTARTTIATTAGTTVATSLTTVSTAATVTTSTTTPLTLINSTAYYCSGISPASLWTQYSPDTITMNINTSRCNFNQVPCYLTSVAGWSSHFILTSYTAIYSQTSISFTVYARSLLGWNAPFMLNISQSYGWDMNWFGTLN